MPESKEIIYERLGRTEYLDKLDTIKQHVEGLWIDKQYLPEYFTFHNISHCEQVENSIYKLIPPERVDQFTDIELFCLISSAYLHDVGMIPDARTHNLTEETISNFLIGAGLSDILASQGTRYINLLIEGNSDKYREIHQLLSKKYVLENFRALRLAPNEAGIIGELCKYHRKSEDISSINAEVHNVDVKLLAAYLRLGDAIHINQDRVDRDLFTLFTRIGMPSESMFHWIKNLCTANVIADNTNQKIIIEVIGSDTRPKNMQLIADYIREEIESELILIKDILARGNISYYSEVAYNIIPGAFSERDKILIDQIISKLQLQDKSSASDVVDSIIKSIISILEVQDSGFNKYSMIKWYQGNVISELLAKRPCHILVRRIYELIQKGIEKDTSELSSEQIRDILNSIKYSIEEFNEKRKYSLNKLFQFTNAILSDTGTILLFGHSRLVIDALKGIDENLKSKTKIYICEGRNIGRYNSLNELDYCDGAVYASSIVENGFKEVFLIPDILVASLMSRNLIDKVIFGANGVDIQDGTFGHSAGHLSIADLAHLYDIPVYVILDSFKFGNLNDCYNPGLERNEGRKYEWFSADKKILSKIDGVKFFNPREDLIKDELNGRSLNRFTALITDFGIIQSNRIPDIIKTEFKTTQNSEGK